MNILDQELKRLKREKPHLTDVQLTQALEGALSYIKECTGIVVTDNSPPLLKTAAFFYVSWFFEKSDFQRNALRTSVCLIMEIFNRGEMK